LKDAFLKDAFSACAKCCPELDPMMFLESDFTTLHSAPKELYA
jgi:hypothetical protein